MSSKAIEALEERIEILEDKICRMQKEIADNHVQMRKLKEKIAKDEADSFRLN